ncbi:MAG: class I SAM-dependent methyltransferase [Microthrixaceae bacterium]
MTFDDMPVFCNVLHDSAEEATAAATGTIQLEQCKTCGLLLNTRFEPSLTEYQPGYENSLHHSAVFQQWATSCAERLVNTYALEGETVLEIGCGRGGFLSLMRAAGVGRAIGYDPSLPPGTKASEGVEVHTGYYEPSLSVGATMAISRHVLEHVTDPRALVELLATAAPDGVLYMEVPDATSMLENSAIYDVIYEHCHYFGAPAMAALVKDSGLRLVDWRTGFGGQYLSVEAAAGPGRAVTVPTDAVDRLIGAGSKFSAAAGSEMGLWRERLAEYAAEGRDVVAWGAGSKGVSFVNIVEGGTGISRLVDLNPLKRGRFVPGTAQMVVSPEDLLEEVPEVVVVMNPIYRDEVDARVSELGIRAEVLVA